MTGRERIFAVLRKETPDRIPVSFFVQEEYLSWFYPQREKTSRVDDAVECAAYYGFDIITRDNIYTVPYWLKKSYPNWEISDRSWVENDIYSRKTKIKTPAGNLEQLETAPYNPRTLNGVHFHTKEYLIKTAGDFEIFRRYFPAIDKEEIQSRKERAQQTNTKIGSLGISCPWSAGGVYNSVASCRNIQDLLIDPFVQADFYKELMSFFTNWIIEDSLILAETEFDALGIQGNIANGSLMNDEYFGEHILPYEQKIAGIFKEHGKYTVYHNCGNAKNLYESYKKLGIDVWETVAPAPMGDNSIQEAREFFGTELILSGNLDQVNFLKTATPAQIKDKVRNIMTEGKKGGAFIFSCSDYLEPDTPEENIKAAVEAAIEWGGIG